MIKTNKNDHKSNTLLPQILLLIRCSCYYLYFGSYNAGIYTEKTVNFALSVKSFLTSQIPGKDFESLKDPLNHG